MNETAGGARQAALPFIVLAVLLLLWEAAALVSGPGSALPGAVETLWRTASLLVSPTLWTDIGATTMRWMAGLIPALFVGGIVGIAMGSSEVGYRGLVPIVDFFRSVPVTAAYPAFLLFLGVGDAGKVAMAFAATVFIVILHAAVGVRSAPPARRLTALSFGATRWHIFRYVSAPEALSHILVGSRTALSLALIVTIVAEMLVGAVAGLGQRIFMSYQLGRVTDLYALILIAGILGYAANSLWFRLERRLFPWFEP